MRYARALAATAALLLILGGLPTALSATVGDVRPGWGDLCAGDVSDRALLHVLATLAWLTWAYFGATVILEARHVITTPGSPGRPRPRPAPGRRLARALLSTVVIALPMTGPAQAFAIDTTPSPPPLTSTPLTQKTGSTAAPGHVGASSRPPISRTAPGAPVPHRAPPPAVPPTQAYLITRHGPGTYWDLAQTYLGEGRRWRQIWELNKGRRQPDGTRLREPGFLRVGWTILLPVPADGSQSPAVTGIGAADVASRPPARTSEPGAARPLTYTVRHGDHLGVIAERFLGDFSAYTQIRELNAHLMPSPAGRHGPDHIQVGWELTLPAGAYDRGRRPRAEGPVHQRRTPGLTGPRPVTPPAPVAAVSPTPQTSPRSPLPSSPTVTGSGSAWHRGVPGIAVPGGWMDLPLAVALAGAAGAFWIRRRLGSMYPPFEEDEQDPEGDLQALPAVISRLRHAVREYAHDLPHDFQDPQVWDREEGARPSATEVAAGFVQGPALVLPPGGLGLTGSGAPAAARALLIATVSGSLPGTADGAGHVIITRAALNTLLRGWAAPEGRFAGRLLIMASLDKVLTWLGTHQDPSPDGMIDVNPQQVPPRSGPHADLGPERPPGTLLLITAVPQHPARRHLTEALSSASGTDVRVVLLGDWAPGPTLLVDQDGHTSAGGEHEFPDRIAVVPETTTLALLDVLQGTSHEVNPQATRAQPVDLRADEEASGEHHWPAADPGEPASSRVAADAGSHTDPDPARGRVRVAVLGRPTITGLDGTTIGGLRRHALELLVYLAVHRTGARLPEIMEALWPDATVRRAQQRLSTEAANLRRSIREAAGDPDVQALVNTGGHYHLDPDVLDIDLWRMFDHLDAARAASDPHARAEHLRPALALAAAELAQDCDYDWIEPTREQLRRRRIRGLLALADTPDTDPHQVAALTTQAADLDPASEDLAQRDMRALDAVGGTTALRQRLNRLRAALGDIDERPSEATLTLAAELHVGELWRYALRVHVQRWCISLAMRPIGVIAREDDREPTCPDVRPSIEDATQMTAALRPSGCPSSHRGPHTLAQFDTPKTGTVTIAGPARRSPTRYSVGIHEP